MSHVPEVSSRSDQSLRDPGVVSLGCAKVAVIDDEGSVRAALCSLLRSRGFGVAPFASAEEFLAAADIEAGCLIVDVRMPGMSGLDLKRALLARGQREPTIFISAHDDRPARAEAARSGALAFLRKPFNVESLMALVRAAFGFEDPGASGATDRCAPGAGRGFDGWTEDGLDHSRAPDAEQARRSEW